MKETPVSHRKEERPFRLPGTAAPDEVRPRTAGEILDDAVRLVLADAPVLLALSSLFAVPAAAGMLLLVALPVPESLGMRLVLPAAVALLLPLTALGSAACQEAFRCRAEGNAPALAACLSAACGRALDHAAARAMVWTLTGLGAVLLIGFGYPFWTTSGSYSPVASYLVRLLLLAALTVGLQGLATVAGGAVVHPLVAGREKRCFAAWWEAVRLAQRQAGKTAAVTLCRPFLLLITVINLLLCVEATLWAAENLAGFDAAVLRLVLDPGNPVYLTTLYLLAWVLLIPFAEASNYLLHTDARARYEGLDLWYRVRRLFPTVDRRAAVLLVFALGAALLVPAAAWADSRLDAVRAVREELAAITQEVKATEPYRSGNTWLPRLTELAAQLDRDGSDRPGRYRWVVQALAGFAQQDRDGALQVLRDIDRRLAVIEQSLGQPPEEEGAARTRSKADIKSLLPPAPEDEPKPTRPATRPRQTQREAKEPVREEDPIDNQPRRRAGVVGPSSSQGFGGFMWMLMAAALVGTLVAALLLYQRRRPVSTPPATAAKANPDALSLESLLSQADKLGGEGLWRQADDLARGGKLLDAVRTLYLAVLAVLHRADLIRYSPTRTNGEYVRQLRDKTEVQRPFRGLTGLFEVKWYGERHCDPADYDTCRRLAEQVRLEMTNA